MNTRRKFAGALGAIAIAAMSTVASAHERECGLGGTWYGEGYDAQQTYIGWLAVHTTGNRDDSNGGEMLFDWVFLTPQVLHTQSTGAVGLISGRGVWEQTGRNAFRYTYYTYGINADGERIYSIRASGRVAMASCNEVKGDYLYEIFAGAVEPHKMLGMTPFFTTTGNVFEKRVPLMVPKH
jgi:hypothetical protein